MTRNRLTLLILTSLILGFLLFLKKESDVQVAESKVQFKTMTVDIGKLEIDGKKVVGLSPGREKEEIKQVKVANETSEVWEENLKETLLLQGGPDVKDIKIEKVSSFIWSQDGIALHVESVIVKLKSDKNVQASFRLIVDAETGKILRNWDQPVFDPVSPQDEFKITMEPSLDND